MNQSTLFGAGPLPAHNHTTASLRAADRVREKAGSRRQAVLEAVRGSRAGLTRDEIAEKLWLPVHAICPRVSELLRAGQLIETKDTRLTRAGCPAAVLMDAARAGRTRS